MLAGILVLHVLLEGNCIQPSLFEKRKVCISSPGCTGKDLLTIPFLLIWVHAFVLGIKQPRLLFHFSFLLMFETPCSSKHHRKTILIASINHFLITYRSTRLYNSVYTRIFNCINAITKWEKRIRC